METYAVKNCTKLYQDAPLSSDVLTDILRRGAQTLLQQAVEAELQSYLSQVNQEAMSFAAVRNGYCPMRTIQTGIGDIPVRQPRARIKKGFEGIENFSSKILPPYLRRTKSIEELIPWLYLKGISTGDFQEALQALLGDSAPGLSATTITRMKASWADDYNIWCKRDLSAKRYVYIWADGVHFNVRLGEDGERACILVIMGATSDGVKELLAVEAGMRESTTSWKGLLLQLRRQGLVTTPELAIGDGALGFWAALSEVYSTTKHQRCWVHKTANVLDKLPKNSQPQAKKMLHNIYNAENKANANKLLDEFAKVFDAKYPKAVTCLLKNRDSMLAFYDFPAEHWCHIRSTNPIESTFATVRLRTAKTKGCGTALATLTMVFKLAENASKTWKKLRGYERLAEVIDIKWKFKDGIRIEAKAA
mgnify:CR=1 FL=1